MLHDSLMASTRAQVLYTGQKFPIGKNAPYGNRSRLDAGKLSGLDMERMGGLEEFLGVIKRDYDVVEEHFLRWIEGNARPWQFSDSTLGDQGQRADSGRYPPRTGWPGSEKRLLPAPNTGHTF